MLFWILGAITYVRIQWTKFYNYCLRNSWFLYWAQIAIYNISQSLASHKMLPPYNHWSLLYDSLDGSGTPKMTEIIFPMGRDEIPTPEHFAGLLRASCVGKPNALLLCHCEPHIHCFVKPPTSVSTEKVSRQFLSILYSHPRMKSSIPIELDAGLYLVGNEMLSAAFVERYLMYQSHPYVFDADYTLEMMDKKIHMFELNSSQYVVLEKAGYSISYFEQN